MLFAQKKAERVTVVGYPSLTRSGGDRDGLRELQVRKPFDRSFFFCPRNPGDINLQTFWRKFFRAGLTDNLGGLWQGTPSVPAVGMFLWINRQPLRIGRLTGVRLPSTFCRDHIHLICRARETAGRSIIAIQIFIDRSF